MTFAIRRAEKPSGRSRSRNLELAEFSDVEQSLVKVGDDVFDVFDADGEAHQAFGDAYAVLNFLGHGSVSHHRGKRNQRFDATEAFGERAELDVIEEAPRGFQGTYVEGEHGARALLLAAGYFVLGMRGQAGVEDLLNFGMRVEMARHGDAVGVVLEHANGQSLDAARNEEAIHGREARAGGALNEIDLFRVFVTREHHCSARGIAVAVQVFRHGMNHDVRAQFDGALQIGTQKCVIDHHREIAIAGQLGNRRDIGHAERRVGRRFDVQHLRIWTKRPAHEIRHGRVHEAEFQAEVDEELRGKAEYAAVNSFGEDYVIARAQKPEDRVDSRHARRENVGAVAAFQLGDRAFQRFAVRVIGSRVIVAFVFAQLFVDVRRGLIDGRDDGPGGGIGFLAHMNGVGGKTHSALLAIPVLNVKQSARDAALTFRGEFHSRSVPILPAGQFLENLQEPY